MARQVLPVVGAVIGAYFGGPSGAQLGFSIGSFIGNAVDPQILSGPKLGDGTGQTAQEGVFRPIVLGTAAVGGNIIHRGPEVIITERERQGKGGPVIETDRRYRTFAIRIAEPIEGMLRIWQDEKLVYDMRPESVILAESFEYAERFTLYLGDEDQLPDPALEAYMGVGNVSAYRGTSYIVFPNFDLTDFGDRVPNFRFEVTSQYEEIEIPMLGENPIPAGHGWSGGGAVGMAENDADVDVEYPIILFVATCGGGSTEDLPSHPVRATALYDDDTIAFDSGWISKEADEPSVVVTMEDGSGRRINKIILYRNRLSGQPLEFNIGLFIRYPIPSEIPEGSVSYVVPGTIIDPEGNIYAAPWGPDFISSGGDSVPVSSVVNFLHSRVSQPSDLYDATELTDALNGIVFAENYTAADAIRTLMPIYMFDSGEHDSGDGYKINYIKRGKPVHATLTIDDLVSAPEETQRADSYERPRVLHLHFQNPKIGYAAAKGTARRNSPDVKVTGEMSTSVPVVFADVDEAWKIADKLLKIAWAEIAGKQELTLAENWLELVPTDVIGLALRDTVRRLRIVKHSIAAGELTCELMADQQSAYTSNLTGITLPAPTPPPPSIVGETAFEFLDIPALSDTNDRLLYYTAASGQSPAWYGATVQRSTDGGANYETATTHNQGTVMGVLIAPITAASEHYPDTTNVVAVQPYMDITLDSLTEQQFLSEGGAFGLAWDDDGTERWEILQYRDAEQHEDGHWLLSHLLRGRLNTAAVEHLIGARFVLLDAVNAVDALTSFINIELTHRAIGFGTVPDDAILEQQIYTAHSQTEWPVAHLFLTRDGDTINCSTVPRHRFGTEDHPVRSVNWTGYRWTATDGANTATADSIATAQAFNVSGWSTPVAITVSQLNRFTGAGPAVMEQIA